MGASIAKTTIQSMIQSNIDVLNSYSQICSTSATGAQNTISIIGCTGNNDQFFINNSQIISANCLLNADTQVTVSSAVSQNMRQQAEAITQQFGFPSVSDAEAFINASVTLADKISNQYNSTCIQKITAQPNKIICKDSTLNNTVVGITDYQSITSNCITNARTVIDASTDVVSKLQQSSVAKQESTFASLLFVFVLLIAIGAWAIINLATDPFYQWLVVGLVLFFTLSTVFYTAYAKSSGAYPYKKA